MKTKSTSEHSWPEADQGKSITFLNVFQNSLLFLLKTYINNIIGANLKLFPNIRETVTSAAFLRVVLNIFSLGGNTRQSMATQAFYVR